MSAPLSFGAATKLIAGREVRVGLGNKSFLISTAISLLILAGVLIVPKLLGGDGAEKVAFAGPNAAQVSQIATAQAKQFDVEIEVKSFPSEAAARKALADDELTAYVKPNEIVVQEKLDPKLGGLLQQANRQVTGVQNLQKEGIDPGKVAAATNVPALKVDAVDPEDPRADQREQVAFIASIVLYMQLLTYCIWVAYGVVEEKASRVVELILSAVSTKALLAGKILGNGLIGLLQLAIIAGGGVGIGAATGQITLDSEVLVPVSFVLVWFVLGYAFYSALFAAAAARVSRQEDLQSVMGPLNMVIMASFFSVFYVGPNPDALVSRLLSIVPPFSALAAPVRMAQGNALWWEIALGVALAVLSIVLLIRIGGRIYEGAVLRMGSKVSWRDAWSSGGSKGSNGSNGSGGAGGTGPSGSSGSDDGRKALQST